MLPRGEESAPSDTGPTIAAIDEGLHSATQNPWETETSWFAFYVPEKQLTGYLYHFIRPNLGTCSGGVVVWDAASHLPWEACHFDFQWHLPVPPDARLEDVTFPTGMSLTCEEPLRQHHLTYRSKGIDIDATFVAVTDPYTPLVGAPPFGPARHFDQVGHVTGTLDLNGEMSTIDCLAMRDRSWGPRDDRRVGRFGYTFGSVSAQHGFLAYSRPASRGDDVYAGYLIQDGLSYQLVSGHRHLSRDIATGALTAITVEGTDVSGRSFTAVGRPINRLCFTPYPQMLNWTTTIAWDIGGVAGIGEDQDVWSVGAWSRFRRSTIPQPGQGTRQ